MAEYVLAVAVALGYGVWFLALVREQRQRAALEALPGALAAMIPATRQASADMEKVARALASINEAARAFRLMAPTVKEANRCLTFRSR